MRYDTAYVSYFFNRNIVPSVTHRIFENVVFHPFMKNKISFCFSRESLQATYLSEKGITTNKCQKKIFAIISICAFL